MIKWFTHTVSKKAVILSLYLFLLLFLALYARMGFQTLNQVILWLVGPVLAFYVLEPNISRILKLPAEYLLYLTMPGFAILGYYKVIDPALFYRYFQVFVANFVLMIIVFFAITNIREWLMAWKTIWLVSIVVAIVGFVFEAPAIDDDYFRLTGITGNANGTANYSRVGIIAALIILQFYRTRIWRVAIIMSIIFLSYSIILTASRGNFGNLLFILG